MTSFVGGGIAIMLTPRAEAAVDMYACFEDITGPCATSGSPWPTSKNGWFPVSAAAIGAGNVPVASDPQGAGEPVLRPVELVAGVGQATTLVFERALQGTEVATVKLAWVRAGAGNHPPYFVVELSDVVLQTNQIQLKGGDVPTWHLSLASDTVDVSYWRANTDGSLVQPPFTATWTVTP